MGRHLIALALLAGGCAIADPSPPVSYQATTEVAQCPPELAARMPPEVTRCTVTITATTAALREPPPEFARSGDGRGSGAVQATRSGGSPPAAPGGSGPVGRPGGGERDGPGRGIGAGGGVGLGIGAGRGLARDRDEGGRGFGRDRDEGGRGPGRDRDEGGRGRGRGGDDEGRSGDGERDR